jgi:hypothetical protein
MTNHARVLLCIARDPGGAPARHRGQPGHHRTQRLRHRRRPGRGRLHRQTQRRPPQPLPDPGTPAAAPSPPGGNAPSAKSWPSWPEPARGRDRRTARAGRASRGLAAGPGLACTRTPYQPTGRPRTVDWRLWGLRTWVRRLSCGFVGGCGWWAHRLVVMIWSLMYTLTRRAVDLMVLPRGMPPRTSSYWSCAMRSRSCAGRSSVRACSLRIGVFLAALSRVLPRERWAAFLRHFGHGAALAPRTGGQESGRIRASDRVGPRRGPRSAG